MKKEIYYCDICKKETDNAKLKEIKLSDGHLNSLPIIEVCPNCFDRFQEKFVELAVFCNLKEYIEMDYRRKYLKGDKQCPQQEH